MKSFHSIGWSPPSGCYKRRRGDITGGHKRLSLLLYGKTNVEAQLNTIIIDQLNLNDFSRDIFRCCPINRNTVLLERVGGKNHKIPRENAIWSFCFMTIVVVIFVFLLIFSNFLSAGIVRFIFLYENYSVYIQISPKFVSTGSNKYTPELGQIMAWWLWINHCQMYLCQIFPVFVQWLRNSCKGLISLGNDIV